MENKIRLKLAIIGSREFDSFQLVDDFFINHFYEFYGSSIQIVSGGCPTGGDKHAKTIAEKYRLEYKEFPAKWDDLTQIPCKIDINKEGKEYNIMAGFNRNKDIIEFCDMVLCIWNGESKGSKDSLAHAKRLKKPTFIIYI